MIGNCICGAVSFELLGKSPASYHCHCKLCQKQGGTGSNAATIVYSEQFKWRSGEDNIGTWQKDTGFSSHFCLTCGSPAPNVFKSKYVWIPVGLLENPDTKVIANLWLESKPQWATPLKLRRNYDGAAEDIEEFVQFFNSGIYF